jgi:hypothetical protein
MTCRFAAMGLYTATSEAILPEESPEFDRGE